MNDIPLAIRISVVALPEAGVSPATGIYETLAGVGPLVAEGEGSDTDPFEVELVGVSRGPVGAETGLSVEAQRSVDEVERTDVVIVPSMGLDPDGGWRTGRYPSVVDWIRRMHAGGATVCSACSGGLLAAESGVYDGAEITMHWSNEQWFREHHPGVRLRPNEVLVVSGEGGRIVTSGAATAWHDLVLYLVARHVGPATAQALARYHLMQWHRDGQAAFQVFTPATGHGDGAVTSAQRWIETNHPVARPVEQMAEEAGLSTRTLTRRFREATGLSPLAYVQRIRIEAAKRRLESTSEPIEEVSWAVGYEDPAAFRRLFKRTTGLTPGEYRRRFRLPALPGVAMPEPERSG
jgi:transcriptional regulator GlxA family with amidase domain